MEEVQQYYQEAQVLDYLVATRDKGQNKVPLVAAAALFREGQLDVHFIEFKYR